MTPSFVLPPKSSIFEIHRLVIVFIYLLNVNGLSYKKKWMIFFYSNLTFHARHLEKAFQ